MTQDQINDIVNKVLLSLKTNSFTIEQLTAVNDLPDDGFFEISGARKIACKILKDLFKTIGDDINDSLRQLAIKLSDLEKKHDEEFAQEVKDRIEADDALITETSNLKKHLDLTVGHLYNTTALVNLNAINDTTYTGIEVALKILKIYDALYQTVFSKRIVKKGLIITYKVTGGEWVMMRYTGDDLEDVNIWDTDKWADLDSAVKEHLFKLDEKVGKSLEVLSRNSPLVNLNAFYNTTYTGIDGALKILKSYNTLYQNVFGRGIIKNGLIITYRTTAVDWETMRYTGDDLEDINVWDANKWTDLNRVLNNAVKRLSDDVCFINLNNYQFAKYGSLTTAIDGLLLLDSIYNTMYGRRLVKRGLIMTYLVGGDEWATKRFVGSDDESDYVDDELIRFEPYWKDFADGGDLSGLSQEIADRKAADKELEELVSLEVSARETAVRDLSMSVSKLWDNLTFFNVNKTDDSNYTLEAAILQTLTVSKLYQMYYGKPLLCEGLVITYRNDLKIWENKRYIGKAFDDDTVKDEANWINFAAGGTVENKNFVSVMPSGNLINIDYRRTPYAMVTLSGVDAIHNLSIGNTSEGDSGQIMVFQTGFKQIAAAENITGTIDLPLMDGTIALLTYNRVGKNIYIHTDIIVGDVQYPRPQKIADFDVIYSDSSSCTVQWTAPWANNLYDKATEYDMRYSNSVVDADDPKVWAGLKKVKNVPPPEEPGVQQKMTITGLTPGKEYYVYLKGIKVNYGVQYASLASDFVYFRTLGSEDTEKAYRINLTERNLVPQLKKYNTDADGTVCSIDKMVDETEKNVFLETGYPDTSNKNYATFWSAYKYGRNTVPYDIIIDLFSLFAIDKLFVYSHDKPRFSVYGMKDHGYEWEKLGEINIEYNAWATLDFRSYTCRYIKLSFDLMDFGASSNNPAMPEGAEGFPEPEYNGTLSRIDNLLLYGRAVSGRPEGIMPPVRCSTVRKTVDQFFCTNGHAYQQGRIHAMCSGEKMRMYISFGQFAANYNTLNAYKTLADMRYRVSDISWVKANNGTGDDLEDTLRNTYLRYGLKPYLCSTGIFDYCFWDRSKTTHNRPCDAYWYPGAWKPLPKRGVGGLDKYYGVTMQAESYKTYAKMGEALSAKFGENVVDEESLFYPESETGTGTGLISGIEPENEPEASWNGWVGYESSGEYAAVISATADGHAGAITDENGRPLAGIRKGGVMVVSSGTAGVNCGYMLPVLLHWRTERRDASIPVDAFSMHLYCSNIGNQESSDAKVQYGITFEEAMKNPTGGELARMAELRNRMCPDKEIWLTEFGWGESGGRDTASKYQCYTQTGRTIGSWVIPDRHRSDVKGAWIVRACLQMMAMGVDMVNYYSTECEANYFGTGNWDSGAGFEMFHWEDIKDLTPGVRAEYIKKYEHAYARGGFATTGLFGQILGNGAYPITRAYWWIATFRNRLKGYVFTGMKYIADEKVVIACFKKQGEDKGAYAVYYNDSQNTGVAGVEIPVPEGVSRVSHVTVYVPGIPNPQDVPSGLGTDHARTGLATARHERYIGGKWVLHHKPYWGDRYASYAQGAAVYPANPQEGDELVVLPTAGENPYFPIVGTVQAKYSSRGNTLSAQQYETDREEWETEPELDAEGNVVWKVKSDVSLSWRQVDAVCDYIVHHPDGIHGSNGNENTLETVRGMIQANVSEFPEFYFFDAVPETDYKSEVTDFNAQPVSGYAVELWWNNTNAEDTAYQIFVSSLPETGYTLLKEVPVGIDNKALIAGLNPNTVYYYKVRPVKGTLMGTLSDYTSVRTYSVLPAPSGLKVTERTATSISIEWSYTDEQVADFVYYAVYRGDNSGAFVQIGRIEDKAVRSFRDTGLVVGRTYRYKVRAVGLNGQSDYTPEIEVRTLLPEECPPELIQAVTDKLGTKIILTYDLPVGEIADNAADNFTLTENDNLRLVKYVSSDAANANNLVIGIAQDSLSDYDKKSDIRLSYTGGGIQSAYGIELTGFDRVRVGNIIGNFTNLEAEFKLNFCDGSNPIPTDIAWNNLAGNPQTGISIQLTDTYGRQSSVVATSVHTPKSYEWGGTSDSGACKIQGIEEAVYKYGWKVQYGSTQDESKVARLKLSGLNNEHRYTVKAYGGSSYGSEKTARIKVGERYSATVQQLGNETTMMTLEDCIPVDGVIYVDLINMVDASSAVYPTMQFMFVEEFRSGSEPENKDVWLREATVFEDTGDGVVKFPDVTIRLNCIGIATAYRVSETEDMTGVGWTDITDDSLDVPYVLSDGYGAKALYVQVKNLYNESNVRVVNLDYMDPYVPLALKNIYINKDDAFTYDRDVTVYVEKDGIPTHYRIGETADLSSAEWQLWPDPKISEVPCRLSIETGIKTVYVQIKDETSFSVIKADTISLRDNPVSYRDIEIAIPVDKLGISSADEIDVEIPILKYNKRMAYIYAMDDGKAGVYLYHFLYCLHNRLCSTDGTGNDIPFRFGNAWFTYNSYGTDLHNNPAQTNGMLWDNMIRMLDYGGGIYNHGGGDYSSDNASTDSAEKSIRDNRDAIVAKTGVYPYCAVVPGGTSEYMAPYKEVLQDAGDIYVIGSSSYGNYLLDAEHFRTDKQTHGRINLDTLHSALNSDGVFEKVSTAMETSGHPVLFCFSHNPGASGSSDVEIAEKCVYTYLDRIYNTYGKAGDDSIWMTTTDELYEHLVIKEKSKISKRIEGGMLYITLSVAEMVNFRWHDVSVVIKSKNGGRMPVDNVTGSESLTALSWSEKPDGGLMVNLSYDTSRKMLAEKYTAKYEKSYSNEDLGDAMYFISRLKENLRTEYLLRIEAAGNNPPQITSVSSVKTTYERTVEIKVEYTGKCDRYRISEQDVFTDTQWMDMTGPVLAFNLSEGYGEKTVYVQLENGKGVSEIMSCDITYLSMPSRKAVLSLGWGSSEKGYDRESGIYKCYIIASVQPVYDIFNKDFGTVRLISGNSYTASFKGEVTGNNTGVYPDFALERNIWCAAGSSKNPSISVEITLPPGIYRVRLLANASSGCDWSGSIVSDMTAVSMTVNEDTIHPVKVRDNTDSYTEFEHVDASSGVISIECISSEANKRTPLNVIEIEEI